jgi:YD repeat-containing protein
LSGMGISWLWNFPRAERYRNAMFRGNDLIYADKGENTKKQYYVTDPHGNVVQLTDESGKVTKIYEYDSFGNEVNPDSKDENPFRYWGVL